MFLKFSLKSSVFLLYKCCPRNANCCADNGLNSPFALNKSVFNKFFKLIWSVISSCKTISLLGILGRLPLETLPKSMLCFFSGVRSFSHWCLAASLANKASSVLCPSSWSIDSVLILGKPFESELVFLELSQDSVLTLTPWKGFSMEDDRVES